MPILLNKKKPIAYPTTPPKTDDKVHMKAYVQALVLLAIIMGISNTSGGIGKNELSAKDIMLNTHEEYLCSAFFNVQLYSDLNKFIYLVGVEGIEPTPPK